MNFKDFQNPEFMQKAIDAAAAKTISGVLSSVQPKCGRITVANNRGSAAVTPGNSNNNPAIVGLGFMFIGSITACIGAFASQGVNPFVAIIGAIFAAVGYFLFFSKDGFTLEQGTGEWTILKGTPPFVRINKGYKHDLKELRIVFATRTAAERQEKGATNISVWRLTIQWSDPVKPPLELKGLDLPVDRTGFVRPLTGQAASKYHVAGGDASRGRSEPIWRLGEFSHVLNNTAYVVCVIYYSMTNDNCHYR